MILFHKYDISYVSYYCHRIRQEKTVIKKRSVEEAIPKFYGATTIGGRGQIVIPAEARKDLNMSPSAKVMVFGGAVGEGLLIVKADSVSEMLAHANKMLRGIEEVLKYSTDDSA